MKPLDLDDDGVCRIGGKLPAPTAGKPTPADAPRSAEEIACTIVHSYEPIRCELHGPCDPACAGVQKQIAAAIQAERTRAEAAEQALAAEQCKVHGAWQDTKRAEQDAARLREALKKVMTTATAFEPDGTANMEEPR